MIHLILWSTTISISDLLNLIPSLSSFSGFSLISFESMENGWHISWAFLLTYLLQHLSLILFFGERGDVRVGRAQPGCGHYPAPPLAPFRPFVFWWWQSSPGPLSATVSPLEGKSMAKASLWVSEDTLAGGWGGGSTAILRFRITSCRESSKGQDASPQSLRHGLPGDLAAEFGDQQRAVQLSFPHLECSKGNESIPWNSSPFHVLCPVDWIPAGVFNIWPSGHSSQRILKWTFQGGDSFFWRILSGCLWKSPLVQKYLAEILHNLWYRLVALCSTENKIFYLFQPFCFQWYEKKNVFWF